MLHYIHFLRVLRIDLVNDACKVHFFATPMKTTITLNSSYSGLTLRYYYLFCNFRYKISVIVYHHRQ